MAPGILTWTVPVVGMPGIVRIRSVPPGGTPVTGEWNPSIPGTKTGVYKDGTWYLDWNGNGAWDAGIDRAYSFGATGWTPVTGEWNPSIPGTKTGVYKDGTWYLDWNGNGSLGCRY